MRVGKLELPELWEFFHEQVRLFRLPDHHRDPFDRLLVAQCHVEGLPVIASDPAFRRYPVEVIW